MPSVSGDRIQTLSTILGHADTGIASKLNKFYACNPTAFADWGPITFDGGTITSPAIFGADHRVAEAGEVFSQIEAFIDDGHSADFAESFTTTRLTKAQLETRIGSSYVDFVPQSRIASNTAWLDWWVEAIGLMTYIFIDREDPQGKNLSLNNSITADWAADTYNDLHDTHAGFPSQRENTWDDAKGDDPTAHSFGAGAHGSLYEDIQASGMYSEGFSRDGEQNYTVLSNFVNSKCSVARLRSKITSQFESPGGSVTEEALLYRAKYGSGDAIHDVTLSSGSGDQADDQVVTSNLTSNLPATGSAFIAYMDLGRTSPEGVIPSNVPWTEPPDYPATPAERFNTNIAATAIVDKLWIELD